MLTPLLRHAADAPFRHCRHFDAAADDDYAATLPLRCHAFDIDAIIFHFITFAAAAAAATPRRHCQYCFHAAAVSPH